MFSTHYNTAAVNVYVTEIDIRLLHHVQFDIHLTQGLKVYTNFVLSTNLGGWVKGNAMGKWVVKIREQRDKVFIFETESMSRLLFYKTKIFLVSC